MDGLIKANDVHLLNEGTHCRMYRVVGAHPAPGGTSFAVWAPNAERVSVVGDFNDWDDEATPMASVGSSGLWSAVVAGVAKGGRYKYAIRSRIDGYRVLKADPVGFRHEKPPNTASIVWDLDYEWGDAGWMTDRGGRLAHDAPVSIYELHLGSWLRKGDGSWLGYRDAAGRLADYVERIGFTHVELMPVMEHPFYGSWGYQVTGYFAATSRYGLPQDLMYLVDCLHQRGIGVILDWVPAHFPTDEHGLGFFDGSHLYEHADPRKGFHPDWTTNIYNYGRNEVQSFLLSSAVFWLDAFHVDGLRVDGVASMLYLDYSRAEGEWIPNEDGSNENWEAVAFIRKLNETAYREYPDIQMMAEESTAWPQVSRPTSGGGLGFGYKWDLGWMHDTLTYMSRDPVHRAHHHKEITFRAVYAFSENFVLPLSHDEVVHGKGSLLGKMPGDDWQRFANLRLLYGYLFGQPGKKLLFMGGELAASDEWSHEDSLAWGLEDVDRNAGVQRWIAQLNRVLRATPALHELDCDPSGFAWLDADDARRSVLSFLRLGREPGEAVAVICNFTPVPRTGYRVGVPCDGIWVELANSDAEAYGGSGVGTASVRADDRSWNGQPHSIKIDLPPLACVMFRRNP